MKIVCFILIGLLLALVGCEKAQKNISDVPKQEVQKSSKKLIDLDKNSQKFLLRLINTISRQYIDSVITYTGVNTPSVVFYASKKEADKNISDLLFKVGATRKVNFEDLKAINTPAYRMLEQFAYMYGIPLTFTIYSSSILPESTGYELKAKVELLITDQKVIDNFKLLYANPDIIKKLKMCFCFCTYPSSAPEYYLDKDLLLGKKTLKIDIKFVRDNANSNWSRFSIELDKSNGLKKKSKE